MKKISFLLAMILVFASLPLSVFAESADKSPNIVSSKPKTADQTKSKKTQQVPLTGTWEEKINSLTLQPVKLVDIKAGEDTLYVDFAIENYYNRYMSLVKPGMTNYEIMEAVYYYVVENYRTNTLKGTNLPGFFQCTAYASELCKAFYVVGFDVRYISGECTVKGGGWTGHAWTAIKVGDELLYFDANIPSEHGGNASTYFAMVPKDTTFYRNARVSIMEYSKDLRQSVSYQGKRPDWLDS